VKALSLLSLSLAFATFPSTAALASSDTTGPGAVLHKLDDKWVSVLPDATTANASAPSTPQPAPAAAPSESQATAQAAPSPATAPQPTASAEAEAALQALLADLPPLEPGYSGACHVTVDLFAKTYSVNPTSSSDMALTLPYGSTCVSSERSAREAGFSKEAR
jgi:hypothetical protein